VELNSILAVVQLLSTNLFQQRQTTHFSPAFRAIGETTLGDSRSIILLIFSPETASAFIEMVLVLIHLELVDLKAFTMRADTARSTTIEKKFLMLNILQIG
jgi:hypothetical protein